MREPRNPGARIDRPCRPSRSPDLSAFVLSTAAILLATTPLAKRSATM